MSEESKEKLLMLIWTPEHRSLTSSQLLSAQLRASGKASAMVFAIDYGYEHSPPPVAHAEMCSDADLPWKPGRPRLPLFLRQKNSRHPDVRRPRKKR